VTRPNGFAALDAAVRTERERLAGLGQNAAFRAESAVLDFEEIHASCRHAGAELDEYALRALIDRGLAIGDRPLQEYLIASGYAEAARGLVYGAEPARSGHPLLRQDDVVELHARATRRQPEARPGTWRVTTAAALRSGMVPPPFWLVPREIAAFADRFGTGPGEGASPMLFVAAAHERFTRIHPFTAGNGRAARLVTNLLLRKLGYRAALARADARDPWPLATLVARSVLAGLARLVAATDGDLALRPLAEFARGVRREALYKAAQRNRLRSVRKGRAVLTTEAWVDEYLARRHDKR
jgi:Fic family protein